MMAFVNNLVLTGRLLGDPAYMLVNINVNNNNSKKTNETTGKQNIENDNFSGTPSVKTLRKATFQMKWSDFRNRELNVNVEVWSVYYINLLEKFVKAESVITIYGVIYQNEGVLCIRAHCILLG